MIDSDRKSTEKYIVNNFENPIVYCIGKNCN